MRLVVLASLLCGCSLGGALRGEVSKELGGGGTSWRASANPAFGFTKLGAEVDVAHQTAWYTLFAVGGGFGSEGAFLTWGLEVVGVPPPDGGPVGFTAGVRGRMSRGCMAVTVGAGVTELLAQLVARDHPDEFGPNPIVSRAYHDATGFFDYRDCSGGGHASVGAAYEVGIAKLYFAPGP